MTVVMKVNPDAFSYKAQDASRRLGVPVQVMRDRGRRGEKTTYTITIDGQSVSYCAMTARECWSALEALDMASRAIDKRSAQP